MAISHRLNQSRRRQRAAGGPKGCSVEVEESKEEAYRLVLVVGCPIALLRSIWCFYTGCNVCSRNAYETCQHPGSVTIEIERILRACRKY
jgi:hypothetical protein